MNVSLALKHCRMELLQQLREPGYLVQALIFPSMFFLFFGVASAGSPAEAKRVVASYATYAYMVVVFIQFTGGIAQGRQQQWDEYLRTLPASYSHRMVGWSLSGMIVGAISLGLVVTVALIATEVSAGLDEWIFLAGAVIYGSVTMALIAMWLGYWVRPGVAMPVATVTYLSLTYAGGIWTSPEELPGWIQEVSPFLPTRLWAELAWSSIQAHRWEIQHVAGLTAYLAVPAVMTRWGYLRHAYGERGRAG